LWEELNKRGQKIGMTPPVTALKCTPKRYIYIYQVLKNSEGIKIYLK